MRNWKEISRIKDDNLRLALIAANWETLAGLKKGFPQYFCDEQVLPERHELMGLLDDGAKATQVCKDLGLPCEEFHFSGSSRGGTDGVSYSDGGYQTTANGWGDHFWRSTRRIGQTVEWKGATWLVVRNSFSAGSPHYFAGHTLVIVPEKALAD
jgi:hypothetical protein